MKKSKWITSFGLTVILVGGLLTGCGGGTESSNSNTDNATGSEEPVTITLSGWGGNPQESALLKETLNAFEEKYPNITVELDVISDQYMDVMKTRLIGGEAADVFYLDAFEAPALIETGVLEPLDSYVTDDFDIEDFEKPLLEAFQHEGVTYGFPKDFSTLALFYNKAMFEKAGIDAPPTTWDELIEISKELTQGTDVYGFGVAPELARLMYVGQSTGDSIVLDNQANFASDGVVEALQPIVDQHLIDKTSAQPSQVGSGWGGEMFGQQRAAMVLEGNWVIPYLDETFPEVDYSTAEVPTINGQKGTMAYTVSYVMNKESDKKDASWKLIEFLTGKEGMEIWTSKGFALPTRQSVAAVHGYDEDELRSAIVAGASYATVWQDGTNLPIITNNFNNQFISAFLGERPLKEALEEAEKVANNEIQ